MPGSGRAQGAEEDTAGGRRHASSPAASAASPEPEESLAERGVAPRGRRGRVPALPRPAPGVRQFPRESAPHRLGAERCAGALLQMPSCPDWSPGAWPAWRRRRHPLKEGEHPRGLQSHTSERGINALSLSPHSPGRALFEVAAGQCSPHSPSQGRQAHCQAKRLL